MSISQLSLSYTTSDGQVFTDKKAATAHQAKLSAIHAFSLALNEKFDLDPVVGINIAAYLAEQPETLCKLIGRTYRRSPTDNGASDNAGDTEPQNNTAEAALNDNP